MKRTPNFFCIGAQKAGTTTIHNILKQHPRVFLPKNKEIHFFDDDDNFTKGYNWYLDSHFSEATDELAIGEITPAYSYYRCVPRRIYDTIGSDVKFIFILRNPIDRAVSLYNMMRSKKHEDRSFIDAIDIEEKRLDQQNSFFTRNFSYIDRGYYSNQVENYLEFFPLSNFLFLSFENDIICNIDKTLIKILDFIEVPYESGINTNLHSNKSDFMYRHSFIERRRHYFSTYIKIIPKGLRRRVYDLINPKLSYEKYKLSQIERENIFDKYYKEEYVRINKLTNNKFSYWKP